MNIELVLILHLYCADSVKKVMHNVDDMTKIYATYEPNTQECVDVMKKCLSIMKKLKKPAEECLK